VSETNEKYDPEGQVVRSTQTGSTSNRSTESSGSSVSVQNNLPNADAGQSATGTQEQRQDETTNYEISKTVRNLVREHAQIRRISVAVLVDGVTEKAPDGALAWRARAPEEIEQMTRLVKTAIGFDQKRGDQLEIVNLRFAGSEEPPPVEAPKLLGLPIAKSDLLTVARATVPAIVVLAMLLFILRPMIARLTTPAPAAEDTLTGGAEMATGGDALMGAPGASGASRGGRNALALAEGRGGGGGGGEDDEMTVENVDGAVKATSVRRLTALVERHPEEALSIVRTWLRQEAS
jgi:flagellar M-ring protein FliF